MAARPPRAAGQRVLRPRRRGRPRTWNDPRRSARRWATSAPGPPWRSCSPARVSTC